MLAQCAMGTLACCQTHVATAHRHLHRDGPQQRRQSTYCQAKSKSGRKHAQPGGPARLFPSLKSESTAQSQRAASKRTSKRHAKQAQKQTAKQAKGRQQKPAPDSKQKWGIFDVTAYQSVEPWRIPWGWGTTVGGTLTWAVGFLLIGILQIPLSIYIFNVPSMSKITPLQQSQIMLLDQVRCHRCFHWPLSACRSTLSMASPTSSTCCVLSHTMLHLCMQPQCGAASGQLPS